MNRNDSSHDAVVSSARDWTVPATVSRQALLLEGSDKTCQRLIYNVFALAQQMEVSRNLVAQKFRLTGPQYSILMAVARFQERRYIGAGAIAKLLHVSLAFIIAETSRLIEKGLLLKCRNPNDRREALLAISSEGQSLIDEHSKMVCDMNDTIFGALSQSEFAALTKTIERLVQTSAHTAQTLRQRITPSSR
jgi:DNA-binding MarR family transcriptional regulator